MLQSLWADSQDFFASLSPEFAFLLCLPFFVAGISFVPGVWRRWRLRRQPGPAAKAAAPLDRLTRQPF
jgi:uncharacterized membrane protein